MTKARELAELARTISDTSDATAITINSSEEVTFADDIFLGDGKKVVFGAGSDLQIYHTGSVSVIEDSGTGNLLIRGTDMRLQNAAGSANFLKAVDGAEVELMHGGATKLATTSTGIDVTGSVTADGLDLGATTDAASVSTTASDYQLQLGAANSTTGDIGQNISFDFSGTTTASINSYDAGASSATGLAFFTGTSSTLRRFLDIGSNGDISFYENTGTTPKFFWDASAESLGIGTASPRSVSNYGVLAVNGSFGSIIDFELGESLKTTLTQSAGQFEINVVPALPLVFKTNNSEAMRIDSSGNVTLTGSGNAALSINTGNNSGDNSQIKFGDSADDDVGQINYDHGTNSMQFRTNGGSNALVLDSSGNLLAGTSNTTWQSQEGLRYFNGSSLILTRDSDEPLNINRLSNNGALINFYKDGSTVGHIGTTGGKLYIGSPDGSDAFLRFESNEISPCAHEGSFRDAVISLGKTASRFKDLHLSGGVYLGGTGSANQLDDYEEGHYTPTIEVQSGTSTLNTAMDTLFYTKVGRQVTVQGRIRFSAISASGYLRVYLPFTNMANVSSTQGDYAYFSTASHGADVDANYGVFAESAPATNYATLLQKFDNAGWNYWNANKFSAGDYLYFTGTYFTNS